MAENLAGTMGGRDDARDLRGVAVLLLAMNRQDAERLLGRFEEHEIEEIVACAASLGSVPSEEVDKYVDAFEAGLKQGEALVGSSSQAQELIEGALPEPAAKRVMAALHGAPPPVEFWSLVPQIELELLASVLGQEHPQVAAYALSRVDSEQAASIVNLVDPKQKVDLFSRMLGAATVKERPEQLLEFYLAQELLANSEQKGDSEVQKQLAGILNRLDREEAKDLLARLAKHWPKETKELSGLIFGFEDIVFLAKEEQAKLFEAVPTETLIAALRGGEPNLVEAVLSALSGRNRRMVEMELQSNATTSDKEVLAAQRWIADLAISLAQDEKIKLPEQNLEAETE